MKIIITQDCIYVLFSNAASNYSKYNSIIYFLLKFGEFNYSKQIGANYDKPS